MSAQIVGPSEDYTRICALTRRPAPGTPEGKRQAEEDNREFSSLLLTPLGRRAGKHLIGYQGYVLRELLEHGGAYASLPVGSGKTLIQKLAPVVLDVQRSVSFIPASLRDKTFAEFFEYSKYWRSPAPHGDHRIFDYGSLTKTENVDLLGKLEAQLYSFDECDKLSNQEASATKRLGRDIDRRLPHVLAKTGTGSRHSITDFSHFVTWALKEGSPVPLEMGVLDRWALALDAKHAFKARRTAPGVLMDLAEVYQDQLDAFERWGVELTDTVWARLAFQTRLCETPGIVIVDEDSCDQPLSIKLACAPEDGKLNRMFQEYFETECTPDGWDLPTSLERYLFEQCAGWGGYFIYDPRPPAWWCEGRREWNRFVRWAIKSSARSKRPLDTEKAVKNAHKSSEQVLDWAELEPQFKANSKVVWLSDSVVQYVARWSREHCGLVFCSNEAFGARVAKLAKLRYYGPGGLDIDGGGSIEGAPTDRSAILSTAANMRGRNLQGWHEMLIVGAPQSARDLEQLIGREHRYGQQHPVSVTILLTSGLSEYAFEAALHEAQFVLQTQGQTQKILRSQINRHGRYPSQALRWMRRAPKTRSIAA